MHWTESSTIFFINYETIDGSDFEDFYKHFINT